MKHYKYPELYTYKKEWIPLLEQVKLEIGSGKTDYVCYAVKDLTVPRDLKEALRALSHEIQMSLGGARTVIEWCYWNNDEELPRVTREYRLEWLDRIIERCKDV